MKSNLELDPYVHGNVLSQISHINGDFSKTLY